MCDFFWLSKCKINPKIRPIIKEWPPSTPSKWIRPWSTKLQLFPKRSLLPKVTQMSLLQSMTWKWAIQAVKQRTLPGLQLLSLPPPNSTWVIQAMERPIKANRRKLRTPHPLDLQSKNKTNRQRTLF